MEKPANGPMHAVYSSQQWFTDNILEHIFYMSIVRNLILNVSLKLQKNTKQLFKNF